jgi:hypothetical protein
MAPDTPSINQFSEPHFKRILVGFIVRIQGLGIGA